MEENDLDEASGLVASPSLAGVLWTHNDAMDHSVLYAMKPNGQKVGRVRFQGAVPVNPEDLSAAPCPDGSGPCLWLADTGNNALDRNDQAVYAVAEPEGPLHGEVTSRRTWRFPVLFPGDPVDAEALLVLPDASAFYLFEKVKSQRATYFRCKAPFADGRRVVLENLGKVRVPVEVNDDLKQITGAAMHPSGTRLLLRTLSVLVEYRLADGQRVEHLKDLVPHLVIPAPPLEVQGEAVAYDATGTGLLSIPEGRAATINTYPCAR